MTDRVPDSKTEEVQVPCEVYSRIVGYLRPVQDWNKGKQQEFSERTAYEVDARVLPATAPQPDEAKA